MTVYKIIINKTSTDALWCTATRFINDEWSVPMIATGLAAASHYPTSPLDVEAQFDPDDPRVALSTLVRNLRALLILEETAANELREHLDLGPIEQFRFTLLNHKGRVVKTQYVFLNPLGAHDIAHPRSELLCFETSGNAYACERWVLDCRKLEAIPNRPDIIRPACLPRTYFVSPRFVEFVRERGYTNFHFEDVEIV